jgi:hypothetical protein
MPSTKRIEIALWLLILSNLGVFAEGPSRAAAQISTKRLVQKIIHADPLDDRETEPFRLALMEREHHEVFSAIGDIFDAYDPNRLVGRWANQPADAESAASLLLWIDWNYFRVRGDEHGREALESFHRMIQRVERAG